MINTRELRIGNLVDIYKGNKFGRIENCVVEDIDEASVNGFDNDDIHPIKLTEEWLRKLGFKNNHIYKYRFNIDSFIVHHMATNKGNEHKEWMLALEYGEYLSSYIQFVHQIQNLYFALTNTELILK